MVLGALSMRTSTGIAEAVFFVFLSCGVVCSVQLVDPNDKTVVLNWLLCVFLNSEFSVHWVRFSWHFGSSARMFNLLGFNWSLCSSRKWKSPTNILSINAASNNCSDFVVHKLSIVTTAVICDLNGRITTLYVAKQVFRSCCLDSQRRRNTETSEMLSQTSQPLWSLVFPFPKRLGT